ncbi:hypothetical protein D6B98_39030 [Bradyrhizobium sp. LVM 105]|nr:hypothetical protein D6B98_39030 [Bradyrhizobium sp. LVM 105]
MIRTKNTQPFLYAFVVREVSLDVTDQGLVVPQINLLAMSAKMISKSAKHLSIALNRRRFWVFLSCILGNRLIDNVPMFCREMGMIVAAATGDRTRIGWARLRQVLLKALLPGMPPCGSSKTACCTRDQAVTLDGSKLYGSTIASRPRNQLS